jgi:hypothetical protein
VTRAILCLALLCLLAVNDQVAAAPHLNQWTAMQLGLDALKAKYPDRYHELILKYRPFTAKFDDGVWHVSGKSFVPGGRVPVIDVRDRDEKIVRIYLQK